MNVYLSLPITGHDMKERWNYAARMSAMLTIAHDDWNVVNPFHVYERLHKQKMERTGRVDLPTYDEVMKADIEALKECEMALFCPGWHTSEGCMEEMRECWLNGISVSFVSEDGKVFGMKN